jgi:REP element-mobilizing transposase RayT
MKYDPSIHHRRSIRLKSYDYSQAGMYFVTICTQNHDCFFGHIIDFKMRLNDAGMMIQSVWDDLPNRFANLELDAVVVMPNHIHGIFVLGHGNDHPGHCTGEPCVRPKYP